MNLKNEVQKAEMMATMIQRDYATSIAPINIKQWEWDRERIWVYLDILCDYIQNAMQLIEEETTRVGNQTYSYEEGEDAVSKPD